MSEYPEIRMNNVSPEAERMFYCMIDPTKVRFGSLMRRAVFVLLKLSEVTKQEWVLNCKMSIKEPRWNIQFCSTANEVPTTIDVDFGLLSMRSISNSLSVIDKMFNRMKWCKEPFTMLVLEIYSKDDRYTVWYHRSDSRFPFPDVRISVTPEGKSILSRFMSLFKKSVPEMDEGPHVFRIDDVKVIGRLDHKVDGEVKRFRTKNPHKEDPGAVIINFINSMAERSV